MSLTWDRFYNPVTGKFRSDLMEITEEKTDKLANPRINKACRDAINLYIEKTGCDPSMEGYSVSICMQLSGNYKGKVLSPSGYYKSVKKAAAALGIEYNVGTHSPRKTFGMINRMIHPSDHDSMEILQTIFNHSDVKTTKHYIGLTKEKVDKYYDDMGAFFNDHIILGNEFSQEKSLVASLFTSDLRDLIQAAYQAGINNAGNEDAIAHVNAINDLMAMAEKMMK